ncbi:MAG: hypothetical protein RRA94_00130 [Bacteroidota bacterium]|nr:hypothetical protein [Bacteroidota bacterium]
MKAAHNRIIFIVAALFFCCAEIVSAQGSAHWELLWKNEAPVGNPTHPNAWMIPEASYTALAYDRWRDVLYIVNPVRGGTAPNFTAEPRIHIWKAADGLPATNVGRSAFGTSAGNGAELPVPLDTIATSAAGFSNRGFAMNRYCLYNIDLDDEGRIFACNLVSPLWNLCILLPSGQCDPDYLAQGPFRVWRWDTPSSNPRLVYATLNDSATAIGNILNSEQTYTSWGDAFDVIGKRSMYSPSQGATYTVDSVRMYVGGGSYPSQPDWNREVHVLLEDSRDSTQRAMADCGNYTMDYRLAVKLVNGSSAYASHGVAGTANSLVHDVWMDSNPWSTSVDRHVQTPNDP